MDQNGDLRTLCIDIGGSGVKVIVVDGKGNPLTEKARQETPRPAKTQPILKVIEDLISSQGEFQRISVGFPGVVRNGVVETAVNLHSDWIDFDLQTELSKRLYRPVKVINDADMQGLGAISGNGVELVVTLGTGFGSALFLNGKLVPNLELGHHPFRKGDTYEQQLGRMSLDKVGKKRWNKRLSKAIDALHELFNYDYLYIGGGEAKQVKIDLPPNVKIIPNIYGLLGGIALWEG
ncbi:MAG: ROK family protein [Cyanobacteria bacterium P01_A01_bin.45]